MEDDNCNQIFADMPSNTDPLRSLSTISRRSLRRSTSSSAHRQQLLGNNIDASQVLNLIDQQDDIDGSKTIKMLAAPMAKRKSIRNIQKLRRTSMKYPGKELSYWKALKLRTAMALALFKSHGKDWFNGLELWRGQLKEVEANFGNGILSYFVFLKSLLFLNIGIFIVEFSFVVIPQILINHNLLRPNSNNTASCLKQASYVNHSIANKMLDFVTGQGFINTTLMFYSNYGDQVVYSKSGHSYDIPFAYILVGGSYILLSLLMMVKNLSQGFTESVIESGGFFYSYCNKVFAGWDYCITNEKAVTLKNHCIYNDFEAELAEEKRLELMKNRTRWDIIKIYCMRSLVSLLVMLMLAGSIYVIIKSVEVSQNMNLNATGNSFVTIIKRWASSLTISILNIILPLLFDVLASFEQWSPRIELAMSLWRAVLLKLASVAVLIITLYTSYSNNDGQKCWENEIGAQMYNLIIIDFIISVALTIFTETGRKYLYRYADCGCNIGQKIGMQEFQIPQNVLDLVYGQSLLWIGSYFAPLLPVIGVLKLTIMFYVKKISLIYNCKQSSTSYQGARSNYFFTLLLLLSFLMCTVAVGWGLTRISTSCCGPFRKTEAKPNKIMLDIILERIAKWPTLISNIINFLRTTVFLFPLFIVIFLLLYYYYAMTKSHEKMIIILKDRLIMEGRDKRFLMDLLMRESLNKQTVADASLVTRMTPVSL
ncbi:transmembrane channel-like protein 7 isoform X3 [Hydra vulgaris]|uniref:Transmembrane channel-like protein 7 isoform X2 n=1 Tax=Hydra vulgaris TaxID=6087 RepID=A0ABM4CDB1_HYDVU